jgi:hypothetical protein
MAKQWPDYMGTYKGMCLEWGITKTAKTGLPQFSVRTLLTEYYDQKEGQWYDVSDNNWTITAYLCLYGRKDSRSDGDIVATLNHTQVCKVFGWDGCGFQYLTQPAAFESKIIQLRISENTYEGAKTPVQVDFIDTEDADPSGQLKTLDADSVRKLEEEFSALFPKKPVKAASVRGKAANKAPALDDPKPAEAAAKPAQAEKPAATEEDRKAALIAKSRRLLAENKKKDETKPTATAVVPKKVVAAPESKSPPDEVALSGTSGGGAAIPDGYGKRQAWCDCVDLKNQDCDDDTLRAAWDAAIAETAADGDEENLDAQGWWMTKEKVLAEIGAL